MSIKHIGRVENQAHHSSPVVIGDFQLMKQWEGDIDGEAEGQMELDDGEIFGFTALELGAPSLFVEGSTITLLTKQGMTPPREELPDEAQISHLLNSDLDVEEEGTLSISSGGIVITLAYNATPEEGASTDHLSECFHPGLATLPVEVPTEIFYEGELAILPFENGTYNVVWGMIDEYERCQIFLP